MKKRLPFQAILGFKLSLPLLLYSAAVFSAPVGNPASPSLLEEGFWIPDAFWSNVQAGFTGDYLFQKRLKPSQESSGSGIRKAAIRGDAQIGEIVWSLRERFNLAAQMGTGRLDWNWKQNGVFVKGESNSGFLWSGEAQLVVFEVKDTAFSAIGQAGGLDRIQAHASLDGTPLERSAKIKFRYWQAGAAITQKIGFFAPYLGCLANKSVFKVSRLHPVSARLESATIAGPFLGCTFSRGSKIFLNFEWRGWFEEGLSVSGQLRF